MEIFYIQQITSLASKKFRLQPRYLCCTKYSYYWIFHSQC